jgi:hypothetical protein
MRSILRRWGSVSVQAASLPPPRRILFYYILCSILSVQFYQRATRATTTTLSAMTDRGRYSLSFAKAKELFGWAD